MESNFLSFQNTKFSDLIFDKSINKTESKENSISQKFILIKNFLSIILTIWLFISNKEYPFKIFIIIYKIIFIFFDFMMIVSALNCSIIKKIKDKIKDKLKDKIKANLLILFEISIIFCLKTDLFIFSIFCYSAKEKLVFCILFLNTIYLIPILFIFFKTNKTYGFSYYQLILIDGIITIIFLIALIPYYFETKELENVLLSFTNYLFFFIFESLCFYLSNKVKKKLNNFYSYVTYLTKITNFFALVLEKNNMNLSYSLEFQDEKLKNFIENNLDANENIYFYEKELKKFENEKFFFLIPNNFDNNFFIDLGVAKINSLLPQKFNITQIKKHKKAEKKIEPIRNKDNYKKYYQIMKDSSLMFPESETALDEKIKRRLFRGELIENKKINKQFKKKKTMDNPKSKNFSDYSSNFYNQKYKFKTTFPVKNNKEFLEKKTSSINLNIPEEKSVYFIKSNSNSSFKDNSSLRLRNKNPTMNSLSSNNIYDKYESGFESNNFSEDSDRERNDNEDLSESFANNSNINEFVGSSHLQVNDTKPIKNKTQYDRRMPKKFDEKEKETEKVTEKVTEILLMEKTETFKRDNSNENNNSKVDYNIKINHSNSPNEDLEIKRIKSKNSLNSLDHEKCSNSSNFDKFPKNKLKDFGRSLTADRAEKIKKNFNKNGEENNYSIIDKKYLYIKRRNTIDDLKDKNDTNHNFNLGIISKKRRNSINDIKDKNDTNQNFNLGIRFKKKENTNLSEKNSLNFTEIKEVNEDIQFVQRREEPESKSINGRSEDDNVSFPYRRSHTYFPNNSHFSENSNIKERYKLQNSNNKDIQKVENFNKAIEDNFVLFLPDYLKFPIYNRIYENFQKFSSNDENLYYEIRDFFKEKKFVNMVELNKEIIKILRTYEEFENNFCLGPIEIINFHYNEESFAEKIENSEQKIKSEFVRVESNENSNSNSQNFNEIIDSPKDENSFNENRIKDIDLELQKLKKDDEEEKIQNFILNNQEKIRRINLYYLKISGEIQYSDLENNNFEKKISNKINESKNAPKLKMNNDESKVNLIDQFSLKSIDSLSRKDNNLFKKNNENIFVPVLSRNFSLKKESSRKTISCGYIKSQIIKCFEFCKEKIFYIFKNKFLREKEKFFLKKYIFAVEEIIFNLPNENLFYNIDEIKQNSNFEIKQSSNLNFERILNKMSFEKSLNKNRKYSNNIENSSTSFKEVKYPFSLDLNFSNPLDYTNFPYQPKAKCNKIELRKMSNSLDLKRFKTIKEEVENDPIDCDAISNRDIAIKKNNPFLNTNNIANTNNKIRFSFSRSNTDTKLPERFLTKQNHSDHLIAADPFNLLNDEKNNSIDISTINSKNLIKKKSISEDFNENLSALLHDFKHVVYDNMIFFDFLVNKYIHPIIGINNSNNVKKNDMASQKSQHSSDNNSKHSKFFLNPDMNKICGFVSTLDQEKIKDDMVYLNVMKDYTTSMILNITTYMSNNDFLLGSLDEKIDMIYISNIMVKVFNRRLEYENKMIGDFSIGKKINIQAKFIDIDKIRAFTIFSNKNMIISLIYNIMSNSYKYTNIGEIEIEIKCINFNRKNYLQMKISDTGSGIPVSILKNWGKAFNQKDKGMGTGLGQYLIGIISSRLKILILKPENRKFPLTGTIIRLLIPISDRASPYNTMDSNSCITIINNSINLNQSFNFDLYNKDKSNILSLSSNSEIISDRMIQLKKNKISDENELNNKEVIVENENNLENENFNDNVKETRYCSGENKNLKDKEKNNNGNNDNDKDKFIEKNNNETENEKEKILNTVEPKIDNNRLVLINSKSINFMEKEKEKEKEEEEPAITFKPSLRCREEKTRTITIICLDDDQVFISLLGNALKKWTAKVSNYKFNLVFSNSFSSFFKEFVTLTENDLLVDYFICDQNISSNIKGVECCQLVNEFYKIYLRNKYSSTNFSFFFFTEEMNMMSYKIIKDGINLIKKDQIHGKLNVNKLIEKLAEHLLNNK